MHNCVTGHNVQLHIHFGTETTVDSLFANALRFAHSVPYSVTINHFDFCDIPLTQKTCISRIRCIRLYVYVFVYINLS